MTWCKHKETTLSCLWISSTQSYKPAHHTLSLSFSCSFGSFLSFRITIIWSKLADWHFTCFKIDSSSSIYSPAHTPFLFVIASSTSAAAARQQLERTLQISNILLKDGSGVSKWVSCSRYSIYRMSQSDWIEQKRIGKEQKRKGNFKLKVIIIIGSSFLVHLKQQMKAWCLLSGRRVSYFGRCLISCETKMSWKMREEKLGLSFHAGFGVSLWAPHY